MREIEIRLHLWVREDGMYISKPMYSHSRLKKEWSRGTLSPKRSYYQITVPNTGKTARLHRLIAEAFIPNPDNKPFVDHINNNTLDNRVCNLRWVSPRENLNNTTKQNAGKLVGAYFHKLKNIWQSSIRINGKNKSLGYFKTEEEANKAYLSAKATLENTKVKK